MLVFPYDFLRNTAVGLCKQNNSSRDLKNSTGDCEQTHRLNPQSLIIADQGKFIVTQLSGGGKKPEEIPPLGLSVAPGIQGGIAIVVDRF